VRHHRIGAVLVNGWKGARQMVSLNRHMCLSTARLKHSYYYYYYHWYYIRCTWPLVSIQASHAKNELSQLSASTPSLGLSEFQAHLE
jgi:hypothetical protein